MATYFNTLVIPGQLQVGQLLELVDIPAPTNAANGVGRLYKKSGNSGLYWLPDASGAEINLIPPVSTVTTSNATATEILSIATASNTTYLLNCNIAGRRTDSGTESAGYVLIVTFRNNAGVLTKVASTLTSQEDVAEWNVDAVVSGTAISFRVTGATGSTINWALTYTSVVV